MQEQEVRYNQLKDKNQKRRIESQEEDPDAYKKAIAIIPEKEEREEEVKDEKPKHINFFAEIEAAVCIIIMIIILTNT